jgi:hypothetical protein
VAVGVLPKAQPFTVESSVTKVNSGNGWEWKSQEAPAPERKQRKAKTWVIGGWVRPLSQL